MSDTLQLVVEAVIIELSETVQHTIANTPTAVGGSFKSGLRDASFITLTRRERT